MRRVEFLWRKFRRGRGSALIPAPENRAETTAIGPAETADQFVGLLVADLGRDSIHSGLSRERLAKRSRAKLLLFKGKHRRESTGVKQIERCPQRSQILDDQFPTVPQRGRRFERTINSRVIEPRQLDRGVRVPVDPQIVSRRIIAMGERKRPVVAALNRDLPDAA